MAIAGSDMLSWFEVPRPLIEPTLRALRLGNTVLDVLFYDVSAVVTDLLLHGSIVVAEVRNPMRYLAGSGKVNAVAVP
jgi:hypothetical protein